ncbi:hypothetical protein [Ligilactobacillus sp. LYQ60]|uniref:hypothetical protein n=1 Tax=unclassified Ligilactobacillus TaxID=2767920 RepID=UPI0038538A94
MPADDIKAGIQALNDGQYRRATILLTACYQKNATFRVNYLLTRALAKMGDYVAAYATAKDYPREYLENDDYFVQYIEYGCQAGAVLEIVMLLTEISHFLSATEKERFGGVIKRATIQYWNNQSTTATQVMSQLAHCGGEGVLIQRQRVKAANALTPRQFVDASRLPLIDPAVHPLVRATLMDDLRRLAVFRHIMIQPLIGSPQRVVPGSLDALDDAPVVRHYYQEIIECESEEPLALRLQRYAEVRLKLMVLYPFQDDVINDAERWRLILLNQQDELSTKEREKAHLLERTIQQWRV